MKRIAWVGLLLPFALQAQFTVYTVGVAGSLAPVEKVLDAGTALAGDYNDIRIRVLNTGKTNITLEVVRVLGQGFTLEGNPPFPFLLTPGLNYDFRIRFRPPAFGDYSATLQINETLILVRGTSPAGPSLWVQEADSWRLLSNNSPPVDFGQVQRKSSRAVQFEIRNETAVEQKISSLRVSRAPFAVDPPFTAPQVIPAGGAFPFQVRFLPEYAGPWRADLEMNGRIFKLQGAALEFPLPEPSLVLPSEALSSGQQARLEVRLSEASRAAGQGSLTLSFEPLGTPRNDDPAVQFLAGASRSVPLHVAEGAQAATVAGSTAIFFQTGTTAGTLVFRLSLGAFVKEARVVIAPAPVHIDTASASRASDRLVVQLRAYDNTRSASTITFSFLDSSGRPLGGGPIRADAADIFRTYFEKSDVGGMFALRAIFPAGGELARIQTVDVEIANSTGATKKKNVAF